jgi:hypothetical protein
LIPNPIIKVLSMLSCHEVRHLLMGGQACVFYGTAEFSHDCNFVIVADHDNLLRLKGALEELQAECIAVSPFEPQYPERGHAVHFSCRPVDRLRADNWKQSRDRSLVEMKPGTIAKPEKYTYGILSQR